MGNLGSAAATPDILHGMALLLTDENDEVRISAAYAVGGLGTAATPDMLHRLALLLADKDACVRRSAAFAVGELGAATPDMLHRLALLLADEDRWVRQSAADAVGILGSAAATPNMLHRLALLLADEDRWVRGRAADAVTQVCRALCSASAPEHPANAEMVTNLLAALARHVRQDYNSEKALWQLMWLLPPKLKNETLARVRQTADG